MRRTALWLISACLMPLLLAGCALPRMIDSDVNSYTGTSPAVSGATYRFERLPSQKDSARQGQLEMLTAQALNAAGLKPDAVHPRYAVQVELQIDQFYRAPQYRPRASIFLGTDRFFWGAQPLLMESPWYRYTVHLLLRDIATGQMAYETSAVHEGPWADAGNLLPLILEAALRDYPNPPPGPRKVVIELPADGPGAR
ncbi:MAG: DUF4136 domain-containing protein [Burkholderiales bacterium]|nr:DUF4136 domain-containing protein [Burkholderiales bacterium]